MSAMPSLGISMPYVDGVITSGSVMGEFAEIIEASGIESVWAVEHVIEAEEYEARYPYDPSGRMAGRFVPMADPLELLSFIAARTSRVMLGTGVIVAPLHSAVVLAKRTATLDRLSGGRLLLGLGIGWQKEEYTSVGVPYSDRGARFDETIAAMQALWAGRPASYSGRFVSFDRIDLLLRPEAARIPIIIGGNSPPAIARCARVGDGWFPHAIQPDDFAAGVSALGAALAAEGRSLSDVSITVTPSAADRTKDLDLDWVQRYVDGGATRVIMRPGLSGPADLSGLADRIARYREEILGRLDLTRRP